MSAACLAETAVALFHIIYLIFVRWRSFLVASALAASSM